MKLLYSIILIASFATISAQNPAADSLLLILKQTKNIHSTTKLQNQISEAYQSSDPHEMQKFANFALKNSLKNNDKIQQAKAHQNIGISNIILGNYQQAVDQFNLSEKVIVSLNDDSKNVKELLAKTLGSKGLAFSEQNRYAKALDCDLRAMRIYEELGNRLQLSKICNNIGVIYNSIDDEKKALQYFLKANQQKEENNPAVAVSASNIGLIYLNQNDKIKAKKYFDESLIGFETNPNPRGLGELYNNLGRYYVSENQSDKAKEYLMKAEKAFESIEDQFGISDTFFLLAEVYFGEKNFDKSLEFADKSLELSKELDLPETRMKCEKLLSEIYDQKGNQQLALLHLKNYDLEKDNLEKIKNEQKRLNTELNFQYEKSQLEKRDSAEQDRLKLILGFLILIVILGSLFFYQRNKEKQQKILLQKQLAEFEHKALHLQMNPHFVFNCLAAISSFIMQNGKADAMKYLSKFSKLMRLTLEFSKESAIPIDKEIEALQNYLELEQLRFNQKFDFKINKDSDIEDDTAIPTLLLQPYVENAIIHGVAPKEGKGFIKINFSQKDDQLICTIEDDGVGIESSKELKKDSVNAHKSMALEISKKRLETLEKIENKKVGLEIEELKDAIGKTLGTKITLKLPLNFIKN
ncbi:tetratricopeptide repeat protein [Epilithonimonas sp. JDS]|uniref:tetratricopeptide repeat protein n=1 Tax=Epilithonimonas sp. JDS TaxID=2902797 RepID=UPI001E3ECC6B|nr:tetratricopeptide repeat protein [Epilithonimonas sp. JDS]MCD9854134.1 tetratricopeptide repeat protein [Epilithonimonas sp. JDS]